MFLRPVGPHRRPSSALNFVHAIARFSVWTSPGSIKDLEQLMPPLNLFQSRFSEFRKFVATNTFTSASNLHRKIQRGAQGFPRSAGIR
jgi:hypothetical protein